MDPIAPDDSAKQHSIIQDIALKYPIAQFRVGLTRVVIITDKNLVRQALSEIHGKGFIHQGPKCIVPRNTFNLDTGDEWSVRRNLFRRPFSTQSLSKYTNTIKNLVVKLCDKLSESADSNTSIPLDLYFGQLTVDVICEVAFQYHAYALDNSKDFNTLLNSTRAIFEVKPILYILSIILNSQSTIYSSCGYVIYVTRHYCYTCL